MGTNGLNLKDTALKVTKALPAGAASATSNAIDLQNTARGSFVANAELLLTYPSLTLTQLPNTKTMTYDIVESDNSDLSSPTVIAPGIVVQTGATGTDPCVGGTFRYRPRTGTKRYVGCKATGVATADGSASSMTLELVF